MRRYLHLFHEKLCSIQAIIKPGNFANERKTFNNNLATPIKICNKNFPLHGNENENRF